MLRRERHAHKRAHMLRLGEESNASSTNSELWRAEKSTLRMRGNSDAQKEALYTSSTNTESDPSQSSGERITNLSE